jgi:glycosyltransferase involved in cell wall biosynthesis
LRAANVRVNAYSFVTPERGERRMAKDFRAISLGAKDFVVNSVLSSAVLKDDSDAIVIHFSNIELLRAAAETKGQRAVIMAHSFNRKEPRSLLGKWKVVSLLNKDRVELVANHCMPATDHLAQIGVNRDKLIPWDFSHPFDPTSHQPKHLVVRQRFEAVYAGSMSKSKGIIELIRAIALLRAHNIEFHCSLAGGVISIR